jgi:hypothetical protein
MGLERQLMHRLFTGLAKRAKRLMMLCLAFFSAVLASILLMASLPFFFITLWLSETIFQVFGDDDAPG